MYSIKNLKLTKQPMYILLIGLISLVSLLPGLANSAESKVLKDYHMSIYKDMQGSVDGVELFTKVSGKNEFFGVTCSSQSPLPVFQVVMFENQIMSETPKLLSVNLQVDKVPVKVELQGILKVTDTTEELSNKVRIEVVTQRGSSLQNLQKQYLNLLTELRKGKTLSIELKHRTLEPKKIEFSLQGLDSLLKPYQYLCF